MHESHAPLSRAASAITGRGALRYGTTDIDRDGNVLEVTGYRLGGLAVRVLFVRGTRGSQFMVKRKLGEVLRERGKISAEDLGNAISDQPRKLIRLGELLLARGLVQKEDISSALAEVTHVPYLDCASVSPTAEALRVIPQAEAERCCALPVELNGNRLTVIMCDPQNLSVLASLGFTSGATIVPRQASRERFCWRSRRTIRAGEQARPQKQETMPRQSRRQALGRR